jgi:glycosyltransferase involved in cell wall biosynthesis
MTQLPLVSIGMPVFNGARYARAAIDSILRQTYSSLELVISDNASTDGTEALCRGYAERDARVRYYRNAHNLGAHPNYNLTFSLSGGDFFKWAPHDDVLEPTYLEACVGALEVAPDAVVCQSLLRYIDAEGTPLGVYDSRLRGASDADAAARFAAVVLLPHPAYEVMGVFRRSALEGGILLGSFHGADRALLAELSLRGRMIQVHEPLLNVRDHKERYTQSMIRARDRAAWHDTSIVGRISLPTWRLYAEYWSTVGRNLAQGPQRQRCYAHLIRWWWHKWNAARMLVDLISVVMPNAVLHAERLKQKYIAPQPGAGDVASKRSSDVSK